MGDIAADLYYQKINSHRLKRSPLTTSFPGYPLGWSIDRIELCEALVNSRLKTLLLKQCRHKFIKCYHIVDSQIAHSMIQEEAYTDLIPLPQPA